MPSSTFAFGDLNLPGATGHMVRGIKVFKAGTFKDSMGRQATWTAADLQKMVEHFDILNGVAFTAPIRADHTDSVRDIVGYVRRLSTDGEFLYADVELTEPDAAAKYERGTYRARSAEINEYETNGADPKTYFPVFMGLAFVDIGAVEGLYRKGDGSAVKFRIKGVETEDHSAIQAHIDALESQAPKAATKFRVNGAEVEDFAAVQAHVADLESKVAEFSRAGSFTFKINGTDSTDFTAVQAHVTNLETVLDESRKTNRAAFVKGLAAEKKVGAPQVDSLTELAQNMTDEQFEKFKASYEAAPVLSLFGGHAEGGVNHDGTQTDPGQPSAAEKELATFRQRVDMLRRSGMAQDQIEKTESFQRLKALETSASGR